MSTPEKIQKIKNSVYLTEEEKNIMDGVVLDYLNANPLKDKNMEKEKPPSLFQFSFFSINRKFAYAMLILVIIFGAGSGTVWAAQGALPGDMLYPIKVNVSEEIKSALIFSTKEKANWEAERLNLRLKEMQQVVAKTGSLSSELVKDTENQVMKQTAKVASATKNLEKMGDTESVYALLDKIQSSLETYNSVLQGLLDQNLPVNESEIKKVVSQVESTELMVKNVQQQTVSQINEVAVKNEVDNNKENQGNKKIVFANLDFNTRLKVGTQYKIMWNVENIPAGTPGYISVWYPSGKKAMDLFTASDITQNQVFWDVKNILPGTWKLRIDLDKNGEGLYWYSDVFVIENSLIQNLPDLVIENAVLSKLNFKPGEEVTIKFNVRNNGTKDYEAKHTFGMELKYAGEAVFRATAPLDDTCRNDSVIKVQQSCSMSFIFTPSRGAGEYVVTLFADYEDYAPELFKGNNRVTLNFQVIKDYLPGSAIQVITPNSGEQIKPGDHYLIQWKIVDLQGLDNQEGKFDLYTSEGNFVKTVYTVPNLTKGTCYWNVGTDIPSGKYFIRIGVNSKVYGDSQNFNVVASDGHAVQVIAPFEGVKITQGTEYLVKWQVIDLQGLDNQEGKLDLYTSEGNFVKTIYTVPALFKGTANWTPGTDIAPGKYFIRVGVNNKVYGDSQNFIVEAVVQSVTETYSGYLGEFADGGYGSFSTYIELDKGVQVGLDVCNKNILYLKNFINTTIKTGLKVEVSGTKTNGGICVESLSVVVPLTGTPEGFSGVVKKYADGDGYGSFTNYLALTKGSITGITTCDQRVVNLEQLLQTAIQTGALVDIIGIQENGGICTTGIIIK